VNRGGFDFDVAELLAGELGTNLRIVWQPLPVMTEIESTDIDYGPILAGQCDLMLSIPGRDAIVGLETLLTLSEPYYGTGFELIPENAQLLDESKVAVRANTVAHVVVDARGHDWTMQPDSAAIVAAVNGGQADVGLVWGPDLALLDQAHNDEFEPPRILRWNQHAIVRTGEDALLHDINAALERRGDDVLDLLAKHAMPVHAPYAETHQQEALRAL
jgi:ABC-type amino acid transport substrate-binding protein